MEQKKVDKVEKVNTSYLVFISELISSKIEISDLNKEVIEKKYSEIVNLKFSNLKRVANRNSRKSVIAKRNNFLAELKISEKDYNSVNKKVLKLAVSKSNKYI